MNEEDKEYLKVNKVTAIEKTNFQDKYPYYEYKGSRRTNINPNSNMFQSMLDDETAKLEEEKFRKQLIKEVRQKELEEMLNINTQYEMMKSKGRLK